MSTEIKVPVLPESVADATVVNWHKKAGDSVTRDETLVELETDKVVLEVPAPEDGVLAEIIQAEGATVVSDDVLATLSAAGASTSAPAKSEPAKTASKVESPEVASASSSADSSTPASPSVRRTMAQKDLSASDVQGSGKHGQILATDLTTTSSSPVSTAKPAAPQVSIDLEGREQKRVPMTRLRAKIAERLVQAQHNAAMLTTFNEVNLKAVMDLRAKYKDRFEKEHGVKLGFMSFFSKAVTESLKKFPAVNASIDGNDVVYHGFYDIGIAVSTERGLVVPVLRDVNLMSMAEIEQSINDSASRAREGKLAIEEMQGGTFTITNGGVFGSLLSTPILNPPQTAILGMHKIEQRPVVENGEIVIRPMMYVAMSYDHRLIDGKESVQFLVSVKSFLEDPSRLLLNL